MHLICCLKQVPDTAKVKIDPETNTLIRSGVESIANPYDMVALEAALTLKDTYGGRVTALSMGPPRAEQVLRETISRGANEAILLSDRAFAGADTLATSYTLTKAIEKINQKVPVDVILCGQQAIDGDTAQVGPGIATRLGYTQFTYVTEIREVNEKSRSITVKRKVEGGFEIIRGLPPAVLTVELELGKPRRASLPRLYFCPANVYRLEKDRISVAYEGCLECGSCRIGCPLLNIEWRFPTGGYGISHKFG